MVRLTGLESTKAVQHVRVLEEGEDSKSKIEFMAWVRNSTGESQGRKGDGSNRKIHLDGDNTRDMAADLPRELIFLELETALPRLSPLPAGGTG